MQVLTLKFPMKSINPFGNNSCVSARDPIRLRGVIPNLVTQTIKVSVSGSQNKTKQTRRWTG